MPGWKRALIAVLCLGAAGVLSVHYQATEVGDSPYAELETVERDYQSHVGEQVVLYGTVHSEKGDELYLDVTDRLDNLRVVGFSGEIRTGGVVAVYGTLRPDRTVAATNTVVVNRAPWSFTYKYAVSGAGALFALALFFRHWQIDFRNYTFAQRERSDG